jgi:cell division protein FtsI (penicillin-binding protein 3)
MNRTGRRKKKDLRQVAFTRFMLVVAVFMIWIGGISVRLVNLQVTQHAWLKERAVDLRQDVKQTRMLRGTILDRNERALAMSVRVKTLYADPSEVIDVEATAKKVAAVLKIDAAQLGMQLRQAKEANKRYLPIAKKIDEDAVQRINKALDAADVKKADQPYFAGLHWRDDQRRSYPYGTLASQVVGFSNAEDDGRAGVEQSQDDALHGAVIRKLQERDRLGRVYDETVFERDAPSDVVLTIDAALQYWTEQALENGVHAAQAKSGMAIVMNPKTGEILALANYPTFDPNTISEAAAEHIGNKAIQSLYSPGSVFKIVTYSSALEKNLFRPEDKIDAGSGSITVANHVFSDHHTGTMSYIDALAYSSNICAIKTGMRVGREDFAAMVKKMGFGDKTGVELPAETGGIVRPVEKWNGDSLASMSIGYEIGVTALQMTSAFATIANDGVRVQPHIIKEIRRSDDQPKTVIQAEQKQIVTAETARNLRTMLRQVVSAGTARRAQLDGYTAAGKTGTAWKFNSNSRSVDSSKYVSSFIGMAPADDPQIVIAVVMDEPRGGARDGGQVSAPVFRVIAQQVLEDLKVPKDPAIKQDAIAKDTPLAPDEPVTNKVQKPDESAKPKAATPPTKEKPKPPKATIEKRPNEPGKLTAVVLRRQRTQPYRNKVET